MADKEDAAAKGATEGTTAKLNTSAMTANAGRTEPNDDAVKQLRMLQAQAAGAPIGSVQLQKAINDILRAMGHGDVVEVPENVNGEPVNSKGEVIDHGEAVRLVEEAAKQRIEDYENEQQRLREEADRVAQETEAAERRRAKLTELADRELEKEKAEANR